MTEQGEKVNAAGQVRAQAEGGWCHVLLRRKNWPCLLNAGVG